MTAFLPLLAYLMDLAFGDPDWLYKRIWHPVALPGKLAEWQERERNQNPTKPGSVWRGAHSAATVIIACVAFIFVVQLLLGHWALRWIFELLLAWTLIAHSSLARFVGQVVVDLKDGGLEAGQKAVQHLVSRKAEALDESGVCRSALESLSENFSDAVIAPLFWYVLGSLISLNGGLSCGLMFLVAYKTINTLDSMWGYRNERYAYFGKFAAKLDDAANWIPARLSAVIVLLVAMKPQHMKNVLRDAPCHRSPNAGWPESAFAYVLCIRLSGPRIYDEQAYDGPWMGNGREELKPEDITKGIALFHRTAWAVAPALALIGLLRITAS